MLESGAGETPADPPGRLPRGPLRGATTRRGGPLRGVLNIYIYISHSEGYPARGRPPRTPLVLAAGPAARSTLAAGPTAWSLDGNVRVWEAWASYGAAHLVTATFVQWLCGGQIGQRIFLAGKPPKLAHRVLYYKIRVEKVAIGVKFKFEIAVAGREVLEDPLMMDSRVNVSAICLELTPKLHNVGLRMSLLTGQCVVAPRVKVWKHSFVGDAGISSPSSESWLFVEGSMVVQQRSAATGRDMVNSMRFLTKFGRIAFGGSGERPPSCIGPE
ncbi:hypothetical protein B0H19DRAFT_1236512 [Mycena capillaripes]|nr:hypothetical protein B0H19DRAFT_1236512 [Mycena capillaripes]